MSGGSVVTNILQQEGVGGQEDLTDLPLSPNEERYILAETMTGLRYCSPWILFIRGKLDAGRLRAALQATSDHHEARRTGFEPGGDGGFRKYIHPHARVALHEATMPGATDEQAIAAIRDYAFAPLDFSPENLARFILIRRGRDDYVFAFALHHATDDGTSFPLFIDEVFRRYDGQRAFPPAAHYRSFWDWDWRNSPAYAQARDYWLAKLAGAGDVAAFPADRGLPPAPSVDSVSVRFSAPTFARIKAAAAAAGVTPFGYFYAVYALFLARATGQDHACTTFQSSGRRGFPGAERTLGVFSNGLILNTPVDETRSLRELCQEVRADIRGALAHELFPYHHVSRATGVHPRFGINWFPVVPPLQLKGMTVSLPNVGSSQNDYDLNLRFVQEGDELNLVTFYRANTISRGRALAAAQQIAQLSEAFCDALDQPMSTVRSRNLPVAAALPDPDAPLPQPGADLIQTAFLRAARERPGAIAISGAKRDYTYEELERRSRVIAQRVRAAGLGEGDRVAIVAERGPALVWSMLGVLRSGATFVVLDAAYPAPRLDTLAGIVTPNAFLAAGAGDVAQRLSEHAGAPLLPAEITDQEDPAADDLDAADPAAPAYFLFTSGSTGAPRCVAASHAPLTHFVDWQARTFGLTRDDRFTLLSGLSHDPVLRDIFTPLSLGATLLIPDSETIHAPGALQTWFRKTRPTVTHLTPAMGELLTTSERRSGLLKSLRWAFWGGDRLRRQHMRRLADLAPGCRQASFYGTTETPQAVGCFMDDGDGDWVHCPIGQGAAGAQLLVLAPDGHPKGVGELGEIAVRSSHLSLGYVEAGRIEPAGHGGLYRTGDLGYHLPDGGVMILGRADDQVKIRGFRVHMSEVVAALRQAPGVTAAETLALEGRILAFVAGKRHRALDADQVRRHIAERLPEYMHPHAIRMLDALPLLPNGKVDRQALLALSEDAPAPESAGATTATEQALIDAWSPILGAAAISRSSTFSTLGGDSLSYVQTYMATEEVLGAVPKGWQNLPISALAREARNARGFWSQIDLPILIRSVAITLIVAGHFSLISYGGGGISALMLVSGYMFGGLQLSQAFATRSGAPILRTLRNVFLPTLVITYAIGLVRLMRGHPEPYVFLFTADFQDFRADLARPGGPKVWLEVYLWYVHCMLHILLAFFGLTWVLKTINERLLRLRPVLWAVFGVGCLGRFLMPLLLEPGTLEHGVPEMARFNYLPTTHISTLALGALIATSPTLRQRIPILLALAIYAGLTGWLYSGGQGLFLAGVGVALIAIPSLPAPRVLTPLIFALSGASLFIYLGQYMFRGLLKNLGAPSSPLLTVTVALAGGVALWAIWNRAMQMAGGLRKQPVETTVV